MKARIQPPDELVYREGILWRAVDRRPLMFKQWKYETAIRLGISLEAVERRISRGRLTCPPVLRINPRVILVLKEGL
jgi:hypothetical protein